MGQVLAIRNDQISRTRRPRSSTVSLASFAAALRDLSEHGEFQQPIPLGARFLVHRKPATLIVIEEPPQVRTVRWLSDNSVAAFGDDAAYCTVRLAFPYIVLLAVFMDGIITTRTQCFYRTQPLVGRDDAVFYPNLYNIDDRADMPCWLCLKKLKNIAKTAAWAIKVQAIREHFWCATFNRSATLDRTKSYWYRMQCLDPRIASLTAWEQASTENPLFPLSIPWTPLGQTLGQVMDGMLDKVVASRRFSMAEDWASLVDSLSSPLSEPAP